MREFVVQFPCIDLHFHKEHFLAYDPVYWKKWYEANKEKARAKSSERMRQWRVNNPEKSREANRKWRAHNPDLIKAGVMLRTYGITSEERDEIFAKQGKKCAICESRTTGGRNWHIDHCHKSSKIRGILCNHCNLMLGHARDNPEVLASAIEYLARCPSV